VSVGQVVPHEVIGMANYTKNLVIGLGGPSIINRSHFLSAISGMESVMGRAHNPVRDLIDAAYDRFLAPRVPVLWILTVVEDTPHGSCTEDFSSVGGGQVNRAALRTGRRRILQRDATSKCAPIPSGELRAGSIPMSSSQPGWQTRRSTGHAWRWRTRGRSFCWRRGLPIWRGRHR